MSRTYFRRFYLGFLLLFLIVAPIFAQEATPEPIAPTDIPTYVPSAEQSPTPVPTDLPTDIPTLTPQPSETLSTSFTLVPSEATTHETSVTEETFIGFGTSFSALPDDNQSALVTNLSYVADFETSSLPAGTIRDTNPVLFGFPNTTLIGAGINNPNVNGLYANTFLRNQSTPLTVHMSVQVDLGGQPRQITNLFRWGTSWRSNFSLAGKIFNGYITFEDVTGTVIAQSTICAIQASAPAPCVVSINLSLRNVYSVTAHLEAPNMTASGTNFIEWALDNVYVPTTSIFVPPSPTPFIPPTPTSSGPVCTASRASRDAVAFGQDCVPQADLELTVEVLQENTIQQIDGEIVMDVVVRNQPIFVQDIIASDAENTVVTITLPQGLTYIGNDSAITQNGNQLVWTIGTLPTFNNQAPDESLRRFSLNLAVDDTAISTGQVEAELSIEMMVGSSTEEHDILDNEISQLVRAIPRYCRSRMTDGNIISYRAPVTNNPPDYFEGSPTRHTMNFNASFYELVINGVSTDYLNINTRWYRVTAVIESNKPLLPSDDDALPPDNLANIDPAGVWIQGSEVATFVDETCANRLLDMTGHYTPPNIAWTGVRTFSSYPINLQRACDATAFRRIDAIGINPPNITNYPRQTHHGVDFFVPEGTEALAMAEGIVVGIAYDSRDTDTHAIWRASTLNATSNGGNGYAVIIRHGHYYVLYGHLINLRNEVWVGAHVDVGQILGEIGPLNDRHLHVEVHTFGETLGSVSSYNTIAQNGILPVGGQGATHIPPYVYDVMQLLPTPTGYNPSQNRNLNYPEILNRSNLSQQSGSTEYRTDLNFNPGTGACTLSYRTNARAGIVEEVAVDALMVRGFVSYNENTLPALVSPFVVPQERR